MCFHHYLNQDFIIIASNQVTHLSSFLTPNFKSICCLNSKFNWIFNDLMVAYITNTVWWMQWISKKCYVSLKVNNLFLTPVHDLIHNCIRDWTRKWDPALNTVPVCPNYRQGIITMLTGGMTGRFWDPTQGKPKKSWSLDWCINAQISDFPPFSFFEFRRSDRLPFLRSRLS